ncbi:MAG: hypothetical protein KDB53_18520 [Planctomycetes bacterium]|nr:hypothetical protein [Planctomycetota bacterium]
MSASSRPPVLLIFGLVLCLVGIVDALLAWPPRLFYCLMIGVPIALIGFARYQIAGEGRSSSKG